MAQKAAPTPQAVPAYTNIKVLTDELWIAQRSVQRKPTWYLYKVGNNFIPRSLKTSSEKEARDKAFQAYAAYLKDPTGRWYDLTDLDLYRKDFKEVAEEWLATQAKDKENKAANIRKFLVPYFHDKRKVISVGQIDEAMIDDYKFWRRCFWLDVEEDNSEERQKGILISGKQRANYDEEPSPHTLNREYPTLRGILEYARKRGYFGKFAVPEVKPENPKANPRPAFLGGDFDKFMAEAEKYLQEAKNEFTRVRRELLCDYVFICRHTGIRPPHEPLKLTWNDIHTDTNILSVHPETKTGQRQVVFDDRVRKRFDTMKARRLGFASAHGQTFSPAEAVFSLPDGTPHRHFSDMFREVVKRCHFPIRADEMPYTPYSLRHTYATFALAEGKDYPWLEEQMGNSTDVLKEHYTSRAPSSRPAPIFAARGYCRLRGWPMSDNLGFWI